MIKAKDDLGKTYISRIDCENHNEKGYDFAGNTASISPFKTYYQMWISDLERDIKEITLYFDSFGQYFELKIPIERGRFDE